MPTIMSSSSSLVVVVVAAIALYPLAISGNALSSLVTLVLGFSRIEQISLLTLVVATIFGAAIALFTIVGRHKHHVLQRRRRNIHYKPSVYPLEAIAKCQKKEKEQFKLLYPLIRDEILAGLKAERGMPPETRDWVQRMMEYTVCSGTLNRGTTVLSIHRLFSSERRTLSTAKAAVLGWTVEFLQAFLLVADDVMDGSERRRGKPCWYRTKGTIAINDSFVLESFIFTILKQHFGGEAYYIDLIELILSVIQTTELGQLLDFLTCSQSTEGLIDWNRFTLQRYKQIVKNKTSYYTFYLPVAMGMITSGRFVNGDADREAFKSVERICCIIGEFFQVQDDYLDCYGKPEVIGKVGTDIQDKKCSWLIVQALSKATTDQRQVLLGNYGVCDDRKVALIKEVYTEMELPRLFQEYEESSYREIQLELEQLTPLVPRSVFDLLLKKVYKRSK